MKPKVEMRIGVCVVVVMQRANSLKANNDMREPLDWSDSYETHSKEYKCLKLAGLYNSVVAQVHAEDDKVRFHFRFRDEKTAKEFCKELESCS